MSGYEGRHCGAVEKDMNDGKAPWARMIDLPVSVARRVPARAAVVVPVVMPVVKRCTVRGVVWSAARGAFRGATIMLAVLLAATVMASCSIVFRSSIQGTIIDKEDWEDGTTTGVGDAKVFLYTDLASRNADYDIYVASDGDEIYLPDGTYTATNTARTEYTYFQSTVTDADGGYDFTGFIWEQFFSEYGKTADRAEVYLLIYHPDYGLWKNPVPLYVVSDVTNVLDAIKVEDLWDEGRLAGTVTDWASGTDADPLNGVTVNLYVAETWTFDAAGTTPVTTGATWPGAPTVTTTTDADGRWAASFRFRKMPDRDDDVGKVPVRVSFVLGNHRANQPTDDATTYSPVFSNSGLVTDVDLDEDGADATEGDYEDAFVYATAEYDQDDDQATLVTVPNVMMQRWRFTAQVRGRVKDATDTYADGIKVTLTMPDGEEYSDFSETVTTGEFQQAGVFDLGTIAWTISDASDKQTGLVTITSLTLTLEEVLDNTIDGGITTLEADSTVVLTLDPTP